jgi:transcription elongation factor Elf1
MTDRTRAPAESGRATTPPATRTRPAREPVTFPCPLCGGEAAVIGRGADREFVCLDCTTFTTNND